jgi:hypothetical protein
MLQVQIGVTGFEPATSWSQTTRSTKLSYTPRRVMLIMSSRSAHPEISSRGSLDVINARYAGHLIIHLLLRCPFRRNVALLDLSGPVGCFCLAPYV